MNPAIRKATASALFAAATFVGVSQATSQVPHQRIPLQITHAQNYDPSIGPDDKKMVYITQIAGHEQLIVSALDASEGVQITHDEVDHEDPAWSPDGKKIAYSRMANGQEVIAMCNPDGTGEELLTPTTQKNIHPRWSPDSKSIVYCTDDDLKPPAKNNSDIYSVDVATKKLTRLITGGVNTYPAWNPDGTKIAFRKILGEMNSEVFVSNPDGSDSKNLTNHWAFDGWPEWSPDGKQIAFASNRASNYQVWVMNADGSNPRRVAITEGRATAPTWTHDGTRIYFTNCVQKDYGFDCEIYVADAPKPKS